MADIPSPAQALFPNLPSEAASATERMPPPDRSAAESIYGSPNGGIDRARDVMRAGEALPGGAPRSEPASWLTELTDRDGDRDDAGGELDLRTLKLDPAAPMTSEFSAVAREIGLNQRQACELLPLHEKAMAAASSEYWSRQSEDWAQESQRQFGGRLEAMVNEIKPLLNDPRLTPPEVKTLLGQFGLGNHPAIIDMFNRWSAAIRAGRRR